MSSNPFDPGNLDNDSVGVGPDDFEAAPADMEIGSILTRCWEAFQSQPGLVLGALLLPMIPQFLFVGIDVGLNVLIETTDGDTTFLELGSSAISILNNIVALFFQLGSMRILLAVVRGQEASLDWLVSGGSKLLSAIAAQILMGIAIVAGICAFVVPGIIAAIGLQFTFYAMIDQDLGPIEALQESWRLTDGYKVTLFVISLLIGIGALVLFCVTLGIGYLLALPILVLAQAVMYQSLTHLQADRAY